MALAVDDQTLTIDAPESEAPVLRSVDPAPAEDVELVGSETSFARCFVMGTFFACVTIFVVTVVSWLAYRGNLWPGVGVGVFLAFWFGPAAGLIGGGTYWVSKNPLH